MRVANVLLFATVLSFSMSDATWAKDPKRFNMSEAKVKEYCGNSLDSAGGAMGCTGTCMGGKVCDYSCGGPEGAGCRAYVFSRTEALPAGKGWMGNTALKSLGGAKPVKDLKPVKPPR